MHPSPNLPAAQSRPSPNPQSLNYMWLGDLTWQKGDLAYVIKLRILK